MGRGDYKNRYAVLTEDEMNITNIGRYGISLFTIGLFAISTGIDLLITKAKVADMKTKKWSEFRQLNIDAYRAKAFLYYSSFIAASFSSTAYQFSKSIYFSG